MKQKEKYKLDTSVIKMNCYRNVFFIIDFYVCVCVCFYIFF